MVDGNARGCNFLYLGGISYSNVLREEQAKKKKKMIYIEKKNRINKMNSIKYNFEIFALH